MTTVPEWLKTDYPREMIPAAVGVCGRESGRGAYACSDPFERQHVLMDDWARYLAQGMGEDREPRE